MTALDTSLRNTSETLIDRVGKDATLRVVSGQTYDPATGTYSGGTTTDHSVKVSPPEFFQQRYIDGENIRQDDFEVQVADKPITVTPATTDSQTVTLLLGSTEYVIVRSQPVYSGDQVAVWRLQCRK